MPRPRLSLALCAALALAPAALSAGNAAVSEVLRAPRPSAGEYFGFYIVGKKVGYQYTNVGLVPGSPDKLKFEQQLVMRVNVGGNNVERVMSETRIYESRPGGKLLSFTIEQRGDGGDQVMQGTNTATGVTVIRKRPGLPNEIRMLKPSRETVEDADQVRVALLRGKNFAGIIMDPIDLEQYRVSTTVLPPLETTVGGAKVKLQRASTVSEKDQVLIEVTMSPDGSVMEIKYGPQMVARAEPEAVAKRLDAAVDMFGLTRVVLPKDPPQAARDVPGKMTLVLSKLPERFQRDSERQKFKRLGTGDQVEVTITAQPPRLQKRLKRPLADPAGGEYRKADLVVESDRKEVRELANKILGAEKDAYASAEKISQWVYENVETTFGASADRTTDVLRQMKGDCTEHALLAVSLLRAAGIPAKRIDGVIYQKGSDGVPSLMWHQWVAAYVGEWVHLDPTWGQTVADATHFAVGEDTSSEIAPLLGTLQVLDIR